MASGFTGRCGGCTLCCKLLKVDQLNKPAGQDCPSCTPTGCSIWRFRPRICRGFACLWYANPEFPDQLRPDRCGVFFEPGGERVMLAGSQPGAWRTGLAWGLVQKCLSEGTAVIVQEPAGGGKTTKHFLLPDGDTPQELWARTSEDARLRGFVK